MKKLIFKKIYFDISIFFLSTLFIVGLIVWTIQAVNYFDFVTEDGHGLKIYFYYSLLNFPKIIERILPFIFFISVFYTLVNYEKNNEIIIFWMNGINKIYFLNKLLTFSLIFFLFQITLSSYLAPLSKLEARKYLKNSNIGFFTSLMKEGKFINVTKGLTIFFEKKNDDGSFDDIFLDENKKNQSRMIYASKGIIYEDNNKKILKLFNGRVINIENSRVNIFNFEQINFNLQNLNTKSITSPKIQEIGTKALIDCMLNDKNEQQTNFRCDSNIKKEIKIELIKRLHKPFYLPVIVLFSTFLILFSKIQNNYKKKLNLTFISIFFLIVYSEVSIKYFFLTENFAIFLFTMPAILFTAAYVTFIKLTKYA